MVVFQHSNSASCASPTLTLNSKTNPIPNPNRNPNSNHIANVLHD